MISVCIPNYNYEKYLSLTLDSIFNQSYNDFEVLVADNASTDKSIEIIKNFKNRYPLKLTFKVNNRNLGFAGNLDEVGNMANGDMMIMLSSDDIIKKNALLVYNDLITMLPKGERFIISSAKDVIDPEGSLLCTSFAKDFSKPIWKDSDLDTELSEGLNLSVYKIASRELLSRCLKQMANPFNFLSTCYQKEVYQQMGGYESTRLINPDKWFHWKLLTVTDYSYFIDEPLFQYRWHPQNQTAQQLRAGHLKYLFDEYRNTIEITDQMLKVTGLSKNDINISFIRNDIIRHGLGEYSKGRITKSFRIFHFGWATYPGHMLKNGFSILYFLILIASPVLYPLVLVYNRIIPRSEKF